MIAAAIFPVFYFLFLRLNLFPASYIFWFALKNFILLLQWISYCQLSALFFFSFWVPSVDWALLDCVVDQNVWGIIFEAILSPSERNQSIQDNPEYNSVLPFRKILKIFAVNMLTAKAEPDVELKKIKYESGSSNWCNKKMQFANFFLSFNQHSTSSFLTLLKQWCNCLKTFLVFFNSIQKVVKWKKKCKFHNHMELGFYRQPIINIQEPKSKGAIATASSHILLIFQVNFVIFQPRSFLLPPNNFQLF